MLRRLGCFFLFLLCMGASHAQNIVIKGRVLDAETGEELPFIKIYIPEQSKGAMTDFDGKFQLEGIEWVSGQMVKIEFLGYETQELFMPGKRPPKGLWTLEIELAPVYLGPKWEYRIYSTRYIGDMDQIKLYAIDLRDGSSLSAQFNSIPGVRWDERGPGGSRRISMRGSLLRSPFGVRNIKAYWGYAPLTSADGSTPAELLDPVMLDRIRLAKGADGSRYGAGTGGTLFAEQVYDGIPPHYNIRMGITGGSYGYFRSFLTAAHTLKEWKLRLRYVHQEHGGYREQEANNKDHFMLVAERETNHHRFKAQGMAYKGKWELPGALDSLQAADNPRQANAFSEAGDAHVDRFRLRGMLDHLYTRSKLQIRTGISLNTTAKTNPYATSPFNSGYKEEGEAGLGGRSTFLYSFDDFNHAFAGMEFQGAQQDLEEYENDEGSPGPFQTRFKTRSGTMLQFAGMELRARKNFLTLQLSRNQAGYALDEVFSVDTSLFVGALTFPATWLPSIAYCRRDPFSDKQQFHLKFSMGYAPPSLWELQANAGTAVGLEAEKARNVEARYHKNFRFRGGYSYARFEAQAYATQFENAILPEVQATGRTTFANKGTTRHLGVESMFHYKRHPRNPSKINFWSVGMTAAFQHYTFLSFERNGTDFADNRIPGIPAWTGNLDLGLGFLEVLTLQSQWTAIGETPINDGNTAFQDPYLLWDASFQWRLTTKSLLKADAPEARSRNTQVKLTAGLRNILSTRYSNFLQLNGFGGRYWNPASPRTFYLGFELHH